MMELNPKDLRDKVKAAVATAVDAEFRVHYGNGHQMGPAYKAEKRWEMTARATREFMEFLQDAMAPDLLLPHSVELRPNPEAARLYEEGVA